VAFLVLADEANFANCSQGLRHTWLFDVREPTNPVSFATMPVPSEADYCAKGGNFGPPARMPKMNPPAAQPSRPVMIRRPPYLPIWAICSGGSTPVAANPSKLRSAGCSTRAVA
jgi:hypothetical protein